MPKLTASINDGCSVACSGGADSLAALMFCHNNGKRNVTCLFIDHRTAFSGISRCHVRDICADLNIAFFPILVDEKCDKSEHSWGEERWKIYKSIPNQVVLGHTLDDANERWIMKSLSGKTNDLLYQFAKENVVRPFLLWSKEDCVRYLQKLGIRWVEDPTNHDGSNLRSWIRTSSFSYLCDAHFGTKGVVRRKILEELDSYKL